MILYNKLYNIDKYGHKKHLKQLKPIFQYTKNTMGGNKKHEIIKVAQENLYMLKRLNERTSFYNVEKWNKDYEISQYYKKTHCLYSPIDFNKTQRLGNFPNTWGLETNPNQKNMTTRKKFFSQTNYKANTTCNTPDYKRFANSNKKRKKFEDFNYRDLQFDDEQDNKDKNNKKEGEKQFKKISEIDNAEPEQNQEQPKEKENEEKKEDNGKEDNEQKKEEKTEEKEEEKENEKKDEENEGQKEQKKNKRDEKEEKNENNEKENNDEQNSN